MLLAGQAVDDPLQLIEGAGAVDMIPLAGDGRTAGKTRLLLHDQFGLDAGLEPCQLAGLDALGEPPQFVQGHVERFLGPLGAAAGIAEHAGPIAQGVVAGIDAVAQTAALADLGEQPRAHAAAQGPHGAQA